jgi:predicted dehydrogenase
VFADLSTVHPVRKRLLGEVKTFSGPNTTSHFNVVPVDTEDCGVILFRFKEGAQGVLWVSQVMAGEKNSIQYQISGSQQSLSWHSDRANELKIGHRSQANEILAKDPALVDGRTASFIDYPGGHAEGFPDTFKQCFRSFYEVVKNPGTKNALYPTFQDGHRELLICEAILTSHQEERWITVTY